MSKPTNQRKQKRQAEDLLHQASKIYHFRKDHLKESEIQELEDVSGYLRGVLKGKDGGNLTPAIARLDTVCKKLGGKIYPRNFWNENVEMLLLAAILVIGVRTFVAQPFIIPTNSMYPTYAGLTWEVYDLDERDPPSLAGRALNLVTKGGRHRSLQAESSGEVLIPVFGNGDARPGGGSVRFELVKGRIFGVWPGTVREYTLYVGSNLQPVKVQVPKDFVLDELLFEAFFDRDNPEIRPQVVRGRNSNYIKTNKIVDTGEVFLAFDILLGDMLFVDRMSYHFVKPEVGDPFVFKTKNIGGLRSRSGQQEDKYYIKRLVGQGGDTLEVRSPVLYRNGQPIEGAKAFEMNANQEGEYEGYIDGNPIPYARSVHIDVPDGAMIPGNPVEIPQDFFYAMGDNSDQSLDSRNWGLVPKDAVIGRAIFIYYPFTRRWGLAK